jgi:hypothetical protein
MKHVALFFALGTILSISACHKTPREVDKPEPIDIYHTLPEITQEGKNTFGCKVNGEVWVPRVEILVPWYTLDFQFSEADFEGGGNITCRILSKDQDDFMQIVFGPTFFNTGSYDMTLGSGNYTDMYLRSSNNYFYTEPRDSIRNKVNVLYIDTDKNIVAGTFEFKLYNDTNPKDTIRISEGRFDLHY